MLRISVVIPHLNQPDFLARCLASLDGGKRRPDQVIVADNGSRDMPRAVCDNRPDTVLLQELRPGPGLARNAGAAAANGDILAFIDADCTADPDWLAQAERAMADPGAMILGGDVRINCADSVRPSLTESYESIYGYRMDRYIAEQGFTGTGNLVTRREVLEDVGPFGGIDIAEDRDWGRRAGAKGYEIRFIALMRVYHPARASLADLFLKWDRQLAHDYHLALQQSRGRLKWLLKAFAMLPSVLIEIPHILTSNRVSGLRARGLAFWGLFRIRLHRACRMFALMRGGDHSRLSGRWNRS